MNCLLFPPFRAFPSSALEAVALMAPEGSGLCSAAVAAVHIPLPTARPRRMIQFLRRSLSGIPPELRVLRCQSIPPAGHGTGNAADTAGSKGEEEEPRRLQQRLPARRDERPQQGMDEPLLLPAPLLL